MLSTQGQRSRAMQSVEKRLSSISDKGASATVTGKERKAVLCSSCVMLCGFHTTSHSVFAFQVQVQGDENSKPDSVCVYIKYSGCTDVWVPIMF